MQIYNLPTDVTVVHKELFVILIFAPTFKHELSNSSLHQKILLDCQCQGSKQP